MITPDFCPDQWIALVALIIFVLGAWLHHVARGGSVAGVTNFKNAYRQYYQDGVGMFAIPPGLFGIVWAIIGLLVLVGMFIFYYYDDVCHARSNNRFYDELTPEDDDDPDATTPYVQQYRKGLELTVWILFVANIVFMKMYDTAASRAYYEKNASAGTKSSNVQRAAVLVAFLTAIVHITALGMCVVSAIVASEHASKNLVIPPVFFGIYAAWTFVAMVAGFIFAYKVGNMKIV